MSAGLTARETRILNPRPRRHHRPTYSLVEVRIGAGIGVLLAGIAGWIAWRGAHPDPLLWGDTAALPAGVAAVERGVLPPDLAAAGWREQGLARFGAANLYEKINGRADFFLSRGFASLTFLALADAAARTVDVELYDMGSAANALGTFAAEKPPEQRAQVDAGTSWYATGNALFLARGRHYARAIGSEEGAAVAAQLDAVRQALTKGLPAGERPWSHALFADALGVAPDRLSYEGENAFSFGFARDVHVARLDEDTEAFVVACADPSAARALAAQFEAGFLEYGERMDRAGATWVKDRYLGGFSRAEAMGSAVAGIRGAPQLEKAAADLARLRDALRNIPPTLPTARAATAPEAPREQ